MHDSDLQQGVAIVGISCRFPGAKTAAGFWRNLRDGIESISFFSEEEQRAAGIHPSLLVNPAYVNARGVLDDVEWFDAEFFGFAPREAQIMDPQHRLFLECAWECLESAGCDPTTFPGRIGVFAGESTSTYYSHHIQPRRDLIESVGPLQAVIGNDRDHLTTLVSYKLNLRGPSITVQTACSTSLVAVHLACQSLLNGESDLVLAGGATVIVPQHIGYYHRPGEVGSPDGHCRAFDAKAQGTVGGNGVGVVALRRLEDALADGNPIHAVIRGSAVNNDGSMKVGYTAPSVDGQSEVILEALAVSGVEPETIAYVETHGSGTELGDPIEVGALTQAFRTGTQRMGFCAIGSVKSNVGHLDAAAGVAGLIKTVLALQDRQIPPSLHFERPNPQIDFARSPFFVNAALRQWDKNATPRRAGVSSFGMGGTNAHVIVEEAPPSVPSGPSRPWQLLVLSAKSPSALEAMTANLIDDLQSAPGIDLADVAHTLQAGRKAFNYRRVLVARDRDDAIQAFAARDAARVWTAQDDLKEKSVVFMFSGQGSQYLNMGRELYQHEPAFRKHIDACAQLAQPYIKVDLRECLYPDVEHPDRAESLDLTSIAQLATFAVEYSLAQVWMEWGIQPRAMIGHDIGEYVAAVLAGTLSLADALRLLIAGGQLIEALPADTLLHIALPGNEVSAWLNGSLALAAVNGPALSVVAGPEGDVRGLQQQLVAQGVTCHLVQSTHAYHSRSVQSIRNAFAEQARKVSLKPPQIPYVSSVSGDWITPGEASDAGYWAGHLSQTVRFAEGIHTLLKEQNAVLLEVGPGQTLSGLVRQQIDPAARRVVLASMPDSYDRQSDAAYLLSALGKLWLAGVSIDWRGFYSHERRRRLSLSTYPFQRQRYWIEAPGQAAPDQPASPIADDAETASSALPLHSRPHLLTDYVEPRNELEANIASIWRAALGIDWIGVYDSFFDLGGHSLLATQVVNQLRKEFPVELTLPVFFESRTIENLAKAIEALLLEKLAGLTDAEAESLIEQE